MTTSVRGTREGTRVVGERALSNRYTSPRSVARIQFSRDQSDRAEGIDTYHSQLETMRFLRASVQFSRYTQITHRARAG